MAATPKATGSAPIVSPPIAVASSGITDSAASATSTMPSGRHAVCLVSRNHELRAPDLSVKSPRFTEWASTWSRSAANGGGRSGRSGRSGSPVGEVAGIGRPTVAPLPIAFADRCTRSTNSASSPSPSRAPRTTTSWPSRCGPSSSASAPSSAATTTWPWAARWRPAACPGRPMPGSTLAGLARETSTIRLGTLVNVGHVPPARPAGDHRRPGRRDVRRPRRARSRRRLVRAGAPGLRHPVPAPRGALRPPGGAARGDHGSVGDPRRWPLLLQRRALPGDRLAGAAQAGAGGRRADHHRRRRTDPHAGARRPLRRRVQRTVHVRRALRRAARARRRRVHGDRPGPGLDPLQRRPPSSASAPTRPSTPGGRRRSAGNRTSCAATASPARPPRSPRPSNAGPTPGPNGSTSRSSTSPTSTTWTRSPHWSEALSDGRPPTRDTVERAIPRVAKRRPLRM